MNRSAADIFHEARELPVAERATFLKGACGKDAALRAKVEALLKADAAAGGFNAHDPRGRAAQAEHQEFAKRNKVQVLASGAVAAALLIGVVAFAWQAKVADANGQGRAGIIARACN